MTLDIGRAGSDDNPLITVAGEIDLYSSPELRSAILDAVASAAERVSVDLSGVPYMDSSGVATLVEGLKTARGRGVAFRLVDPSDSVMNVLGLARLDSLFEVGPAP